MLGWTALLLWAHRRPVERRVVAALTVVVIYGLVATEALAVASGAMPPWHMLPTWVLQVGLVLLFATVFHYQTLRRWLAA